MLADRCVAGFILLAMISLPAAAQDAETGIAVPVTITGGALYSHRMQGDNPGTGPLAGAFHATFSPSLRLNAHWFAYASIQLRSTPFYYYDAFEADRTIRAQAVQAFVGYTMTYKSATLLVKAGQLITAFGSFPLHYDDSDNPLLDQPLSYSTYLNLPPVEMGCNAQSLTQSPGVPGTGSPCSGWQANSYGLTPVTLYGLPGVEVDLSAHKLDTRLQLTNSSPANPQNLLSGSQHAQWAAGGGYTVIQGFRVGGSVFQGPYLNRTVAAFLPLGKRVIDFPATGAGLDAQWARGRWSTSGEWQWFRFDTPGFRISPSTSVAYAEVKAVLAPRFYAALRLADQRNGRVAGFTQPTSEAFEANVQAYEFAIGFRPDRWQLFKIGYEWLRSTDVPGTRDNVLGIQLVTSIQPLSKVWR
jgi:hypothetical protein